MIARPTSSLLASILLIAQLVASPFAHGAPGMSSDSDCEGTETASHASTDAIAECTDCLNEHSIAPHESGTDDHHCRTHFACSCPCAHTPALHAFRVVTLRPTPPAAVDGVLAAGTFDPPLFDLLRPPN